MMSANNCFWVIKGNGNDEKDTVNLAALPRALNIGFTVLVSFFIAGILYLRASSLIPRHCEPDPFPKLRDGNLLLIVIGLGSILATLSQRLAFFFSIDEKKQT